MSDLSSATTHNELHRAAAPSPDGPPRFKRKIWIVDWGMQGRYAMHLMLVSLLTGLIVTIGMGYFFLFVAPEQPVQSEAWEGVLGRLMFEIGIISFLIVLLTSVFLSHRLAGPAYRLRRSAEAVARGERGFRIHLRRHDQMKPAAEAFNAMLDSLETLEASEAARRYRAADALAQALDKLRAEDEAELPEALRLLEEAESQLRERTQ